MKFTITSMEPSSAKLASWYWKTVEALTDYNLLCREWVRPAHSMRFEILIPSHTRYISSKRYATWNPKRLKNTCPLSVSDNRHRVEVLLEARREPKTQGYLVPMSSCWLVVTMEALENATEFQVFPSWLKVKNRFLLIIFCGKLGFQDKSNIREKLSSRIEPSRTLKSKRVSEGAKRMSDDICQKTQEPEKVQLDLCFRKNKCDLHWEMKLIFKQLREWRKYEGKRFLLFWHFPGSTTVAKSFELYLYLSHKNHKFAQTRGQPVGVLDFIEMSQLNTHCEPWTPCGRFSSTFLIIIIPVANDANDVITWPLWLPLSTSAKCQSWSRITFSNTYHLGWPNP